MVEIFRLHSQPPVARTRWWSWKRACVGRDFSLITSPFTGGCICCIKSLFMLPLCKWYPLQFSALFLNVEYEALCLSYELAIMKLSTKMSCCKLCCTVLFSLNNFYWNIAFCCEIMLSNYIMICSLNLFTQFYDILISNFPPILWEN